MLMMQNPIGLLGTDAGVDTSDLTQMSFDLRRRDYDRERRLILLGQLEERLVSGPTLCSPRERSAARRSPTDDCKSKVSWL